MVSNRLFILTIRIESVIKQGSESWSPIRDYDSGAVKTCDIYVL
jgi:hypothetical protein